MIEQHAPADNEKDAAEAKNLRSWRHLTGYTIAAIVFLMSAMVLVILSLTVFRVKEPIILMKGVRLAKLVLLDGIFPIPGSNMSMVADVSVKNPNAASFKYHNTTTILYYNGSVIGEAHGPGGRAGARRTKRMNITVDIITDRILRSPDLSNDLQSGLLTISSYSRVPGRIKILALIKRQVVVTMNCTIEVEISTRRLRSQTCRRRVHI